MIRAMQAQSKVLKSSVLLATFLVFAREAIDLILDGFIPMVGEPPFLLATSQLPLRCSVLVERPFMSQIPLVAGSIPCVGCLESPILQIESLVSPHI